MRKKYTFLLIVLVLGAIVASAQGSKLFDSIILKQWLKIGGTSAAHSSAALEINSTTKGMLPPRMTETQRDAITSPATGLVIYNTDTDRLNVYDGAGWVEVGEGAGGEGGINFITNGQFEKNTEGWTPYADAAGAEPVDCTGGEADITFTRNTSFPLRGTGDAKLSKDDSDRQGQGVSIDFEVDNQDADGISTAMYVSFDYVTGSTYQSGDIKLFIKDLNGSIYPIHGPPGSEDGSLPASTSPTKYTGFFFTVPDHKKYRLCAHVATDSATDFDVWFDSVKVTPQGTAPGAIQTIAGRYQLADNQAFAPEAIQPLNFSAVINETYPMIEGSGTSTKFIIPESGWYHLHAHIRISSEGNPTYTNAFPELRYTVNGSVVILDGVGNESTNRWRYFGGGDVRYLEAGDVVDFQFRRSSGEGNVTVVAGYASIIKINSGSQQIVGTNEFLFNGVKVRAYKSAATQTLTSGGSTDIIVLDAETFDSHNAFASNTFTAPKSAWYYIEGQQSAPNGASNIRHDAYLYVNGSSVAQNQAFSLSTLSARSSPKVSIFRFLNKGDTVDMRGWASGADAVIENTSAATYLQIFEVFDPTAWTVVNPYAVDSNATNEKVVRAQVFCGTTSAVIAQSGSWITMGNRSNNVCSFTIANGIFSATPICVGNLADGAGNAHNVNVTASSATAGAMGCVTNGTNACTFDYTANIICMGPQ